MYWYLFFVFFQKLLFCQVCKFFFIHKNWSVKNNCTGAKREVPFAGLLTDWWCSFIGLVSRLHKSLRNTRTGDLRTGSRDQSMVGDDPRKNLIRYKLKVRAAAARFLISNQRLMRLIMIALRRIRKLLLILHQCNHPSSIFRFIII